MDFENLLQEIAADTMAVHRIDVSFVNGDIRINGVIKLQQATDEQAAKLVEAAKLASYNGAIASLNTRAGERGRMFLRR